MHFEDADFTEIIDVDAALTAPMAVCTIDDVMRWALDSQWETTPIDYNDLEEPLTCASASGLCE